MTQPQGLTLHKSCAQDIDFDRLSTLLMSSSSLSILSLLMLLGSVRHFLRCRRTVLQRMKEDAEHLLEKEEVLRVDLLTKHLCPRIDLHMQAELRPILLRRMKEDVENLPEKEEVVVRVQLTAQQRHFYKAIFAKQAASLLYVVMAMLDLALHTQLLQWQLCRGCALLLLLLRLCRSYSAAIEHAEASTTPRLSSSIMPAASMSYACQK